MHTLSLINLGTQAFARDDFAEAVRLYDEARPPRGSSLYSDVYFHAYRGTAYSQVGRSDDALWDARAALAMLRNSETVPPESQVRNAASAVDLDMIYALIVPLLKTGGDPEFESARAAYLALPAADWYAYANRAAVLEQIGELSSALTMNEQALLMQPDHPAVLNNHCYILTRANRAEEALPFCERAVRSAPGIGAVHHSLAAALALLGRCNSAEQALAEARRLDPATVEYREPLVCTAR
jgi:Flp pilus assembly protein TadD